MFFKSSLTLSLLLFTCFAHANLGGEISWQCDGNGNFVFEVVRYTDCSAGIIGTTPTSISWNGGAAISCALVDSSFISPQNSSSSTSISCDTTIIYTPIKRYVYRSAPISIPLPVPTGGYQFWVALSGRPVNTNVVNGTTNGFMLRAQMYPYTAAAGNNLCYDNSPKFGETPQYAFSTNTNQFYIGASDADSQDSVAVDWAPGWSNSSNYPGTPLVYAPGYTFNQPLPGPAINPSNQAPVLSPNGYLTFNSITQGRFSTCFKINSYRNGQLLASVYQDFEMQIFSDPGVTGICGNPPNLPPNVQFQYYAGFDTLTPVSFNNQIAGYEMTVLAGTPIKFAVQGQDYDLLPSCVPQSLLATAKGVALADTSGNCFNPPCAVFSSLNPGGGFVSTLTNSVLFEWTPIGSHVDSTTGVGQFDFFFAMTDDNAIIPSATEVKVTIKVQRPIALNKQFEGICSGDSVKATVLGDTIGLSWSPNTNISCTSCPNPTFYPTTSTVYTVSNANSSYTESIDIQVAPALPLPQLGVAGNDLVVGNPGFYDTLTWFRNGAPFYPTPSNIYTPYLSGTYTAKGSSGVCDVQAQNINLSFSNNLMANNDSNGTYFATRNTSMTHGCTFSLQNEPYYSLDGIYLHAFANNTQNDLSALYCRIYDVNQNLVFTSDSASRFDADIIKFNGEVVLATNSNYLLAIHTDTSVSVPTYKPNNWPTVASDGRVLVFNATTSFGQGIPTTNAQDYPYFYISLKNGIDIAELVIEDKFMAYPNPSNSKLHIAATGMAQYKLSNGLGKTVAQGVIDEQGVIDVASFSSGVYILELTFKNGTQQVQKVIID